MSDYGRYQDDTRTTRRTRGYGDRDRSYGRDRDSNSIFNYGGSQGRDRDMSRRGGRDSEGMGGWAGSGRTSAYDRTRDRDRDDHRDRDSNRERNKYYGRDDSRNGLPIEETSRLIGSNKVEGTPVYGRNGEKLGSIYNFMVDKLSGKVEYAVMSYGGFLGMGQRYYPLPWRMLSYDTREGGYHIDMSESDLEDAPSFDRDSEPNFDRSYGREVHGWYGLNY